MISPRLYTWYDVETTFRQAFEENQWPDDWVNMDVTPNQVLIEVGQESSVEAKQLAWKALEGIFLTRVSLKQEAIVLEASHGTQRLLPVRFEFIPGLKRTRHQPRPLFRGPRFRPGDREPSLRKGAPPILAFYSYKGGVGRTLALLGLARILAGRDLGSEKKLPLLIIDADFEAPGLTWFARKQGGFQDFSFFDALSLVHGTPDWETDALPLITERVQAEMLRLPVKGRITEHFFLPAFRDEVQLLNPPLRLDQLLRSQDRHWVMADLLFALGESLNVSAVLVDLRAGMSELSAPLLFDPRVRRIVVTSTSMQAVQGTELIIKELKRWLAPGIHSSDPVVLISMIPSDYGASLVDNIRECLQRAYSSLEPTDDELIREAGLDYEPLAVWELPFANELVHLGDLDDVDVKLTGAWGDTSLRGLADDLVSVVSTEAISPPPDPQMLLEKLSGFCYQLEYAETGNAKTFLRTIPLRNLARKYAKEAPRAVVMGSKGSGKTFTYLQLLRERDWGAFISKFELNSTGGNHPVLPLVRPRNLEQLAAELSQGAWEHAHEILQTTSTLEPKKVAEKLQRFIETQQKGELQWRDFWLQVMAETVGIPTSDEPLLAIQRFLENKDLYLTFLVDGLEDWLQNAHNSENEQAAIRGLCLGVLDQLANLPNRRVGIVVFIRKDLVLASVRQNFGQLERLHETYELRWNADEALRLVIWAVQEAGIAQEVFPTTANIDPGSLARSELQETVLPLWGRKLGTDQGNEAYTTNWVLSALSDFQGRLQARDLIRFLSNAARNSSGGQDLLRKSDRFLQISAIKNAIKPCGEKKISEIKEEMPVLKKTLDRIQNAEDSHRRMPFARETFSLETDEITQLKDQGIVYEEEGKLYTPEIYRQGLGLALIKGSRPKVVTMMRRALANAQR